MREEKTEKTEKVDQDALTCEHGASLHEGTADAPLVRLRVAEEKIAEWESVFREGVREGPDGKFFLYWTGEELEQAKDEAARLCVLFGVERGVTRKDLQMKLRAVSGALADYRTFHRDYNGCRDEGDRDMRCWCCKAADDELA